MECGKLHLQLLNLYVNGKSVQQCVNLVILKHEVHHSVSIPQVCYICIYLLYNVMSFNEMVEKYNPRTFHV